MPITLDKEAEEFLHAHPEITEEVSAYAIFLAKVRQKHSDEAIAILKDAASFAFEDERTWEEHSNDLENILDEVSDQGSKASHGH